MSTMATPETHYRLVAPVSEDTARALADYSPLVQQLFAARGITTAADAQTFLAPDYATLHDPFLFTDMARAVERILNAIAAKERIVIYSDYDCDGIPGGVLLHDFFRAIGYEEFENYIPHRHHEGYGLNVEAMDALADWGATLIISVDCGITDVEPAARAKERGIDLIITDHHELGAVLPDAYAVINPKRDDAYPFAGLCGSGVAFKLVQALIARGSFDLKSGWEKWWLDVVGIATIADMVPLVGENRTLAHFGLQVLRKTRRPGLQHLFRAMRLDQRTLTEDDIGFMIGPRINAASRMDTPEDAFAMLATRDEADAGTHARHLEKLNNERKGVVAAMVKEINRRVAQITEMPAVIVMGDPQWRPALVGLAANTLSEKFSRPVFLWGRDGREVIKGSCRSDGVMSVVELMHAARDAFIEYGGHHASGGFSVEQTHIHTLEQRLNHAHASLRQSAARPVRTVSIDAVLSLEEVTDALVRDITSLAPFGEGNPKPLFAFREVVPQSVELFGKGKDHLKVLCTTTRGPLEAIAFFAQPEQFQAPLVVGASVTLVAHLERSTFRGRAHTRLRIVDALPPAYDLC